MVVPTEVACFHNICICIKGQPDCMFELKHVITLRYSIDVKSALEK